MTTPVDPKRVALKPRNVAWDWSGLAAHYLDGNPVATHFINAFNMLLPEGEVFFVRTFQEALPFVTDESVRQDVLGFIGQEATHSAAHESVLEHLAAEGLPTAAFTDQIRWFFRGLLGDRNLSGAQRHSWLVQRVAIVAALEHVTSYLGNWGLNAQAWDIAMEPRMRDLLLWHLAEEVEHRHVAFDLFNHLDGNYIRRIRAHLIAFPTFMLLAYRGLQYLAAADKGAPNNPIKVFIAYLRATRKKLIPGLADVVAMALEYFRPRYHPSNYGSTSQAVSYLASSPAALAAAIALEDPA